LAYHTVVAIPDFIDCRSLSRPPSHNAEREQALKLLRAFLDVPQGISFLNQGLVKAVVAVAEMGAQGDDKLAGIATETLAELRSLSLSS
jgi:hypothetical protein